jgi:hypothetical protein
MDRVLTVSNLRRVALTFGSPLAIKDVAMRVGQALCLTLEERESMYLGGDYYRSISADHNVVVQHNDDLGEQAEPSHPELPTLVRVAVTAASAPDVVTAMRSLGLIMIDRNA